MANIRAGSHVATGGDDGGPGSEENPFATLACAREAVGELKRPRKGPITVQVGGGTYYQREPLVFGPADSCTPGGRITYAAAHGEKNEILTLAKWQALGYDRNSTFADPLFVDPENGDYRVRPDSPALKLGFENFPMDHFGLLPDFPRHWEQ